MDFNSPIYLILIPIVLIIMILILKKYEKPAVFLVIFRFIIYIILILALAEPFLSKNTDITTTIFSIDLSDSMKGTEAEIIDFLNKALQYKTDKDNVSIVCFGERAQLEKKMADSSDIKNFTANISKRFTNIAGALDLSASLIPENEKKRIVLISEGGENIGSAEESAKSIRNQGIIVNVVPVQNVIEEEVQVTRVNVPGNIGKNMSYDIEVLIHSMYNTRTKLILYKGSSIIANQFINIRKGENRFVLSDIAETGGGVIYKAEIQPEKDTFYENNAAYSYAYVEDIPNILILDKDNSAYKIREILENSLVNITVQDSISATSEAERLNIYDAVIIADVSAQYLPPQFLSLLEGYVKDSGGGVLVTGGEHSYALGDYFDTELETILPVDMRLEENTKLPDLSMVIVLDRSGSMESGRYGVSKLELAKEASIRAAETMDEKDSLGILAFDDSPEWVSSLQKISGNKQKITDDISAVSIGGGTSILPALEAAYLDLKGTDTRLKHIILLTDGQAEQDGYDSLLSSMKNENITLSTIAVGIDSDRRLLERLADKGGGRYYYTDEFTDLPRIFARETVIASDDYINNRTFFPTVSETTEILSGVDGIPEISGYIATTAKDRADVVLVSDKDAPIIAAWQYGLGRTVAFTSDVDKWTVNWFASDEGIKIFRNMVSWILRKQANTGVDISIEAKSGKSDVIVNMPYSENITGLSATVLKDEEKYEMKLDSAAPGRYIGEIPANSDGTYIVNLQIEEESGYSLITRGVTVPYSKEYDVRNFKNGAELLKNIANSTGGAVITDPGEVFTSIDDGVQTKKDLRSLFLIIALVLFLFDIYFRRFPFVIQKLRQFCYNTINRADFSIMKHKGDSPIKRVDAEIYEEKAETPQKQKKSSDTSNILAEKKRKRLGR